MESQQTCPIPEKEEAASNQQSTSPRKNNKNMKNIIITHISNGLPSLHLVLVEVLEAAMIQPLT
jgi:hypothetical protein